MPDFRVADTAPEHRKLRTAGLAAAGLWALAGAYAMRELTDGWVPEYWVTTWPAGKRQASTLVSVGLWRREKRDGLPGYSFHDWTGYQRPADKIHEDRRKGRERAAKSRHGSGARSPERNAEPAGEDDPYVRPESHDSLPLPLEVTPVGQPGASPERANDRGANTSRPIPDGWTPHEGHIRTARHRDLPIEHEATQFVAHAQANGRVAHDWDAAFTSWLGNARPRNGNPWTRTSRDTNSTDANIADMLGHNPWPEQRALGGA